MRKLAAKFAALQPMLDFGLLRIKDNVMNAGKFLDEASARLSQIFTAGPAADIEKNIKAVLSSIFTRMELVTREEFDVQKEVLARTREKLTQLEARLAELEKR